MVIRKTNEQIQIMRAGGEILAEVQQIIRSHCRAGTFANELDERAEREIIKRGAEPAFKNYLAQGQRYPATLCISINDELVHALPKKEKILKEGDVVSIDCGVLYQGLYTDMAVTFGVGLVSGAAQHLIETTERALSVGISHVCAGICVADIAESIQKIVEEEKLCVVTALVGHGIGTNIHEPPQIPNFWFPKQMKGGVPHQKNYRGERLPAGAVICIEPMVSIGTPDIKTDADGFGILTKDGSLSAHFEHTVLVTDAGAEVLTRLNDGAMKFLGIDYGEKKIGIAISDAAHRIALVYDVIKARDFDARLREIIQEDEIGRVVVGIPGTESDQTKKIQRFVECLQKQLSIPVVTEDESFTSKMATRLMRDEKRKEREDAVAAQILLQSYLDRINLAYE